MGRGSQYINNLQIVFDKFEKECNSTNKVPEELIRQCHLLPDDILENSSISILDYCFLINLPINSSDSIEIQLCNKPNYEAESVYLIKNNYQIDITSHILPINSKARIDNVFKKALDYVQIHKHPVKRA